LHNILAHSIPRPFVGNLDGYGGGASKDDVMRENFLTLGKRQQGKKQGKKAQHQPKEKTGNPNANLPRTSLLNNTSIVIFMAG
jgi:hypothetical protein